MKRFYMLAAVVLAASWIFDPSSGGAQQNIRRIALRSGESVELMNVFDIVNCRSVATGPMEVEILEGPPGLTLTIKEQPIIPRAYNCANPVPGGKLIATASNVDEPKEGKLTFRVKSKAKNGDHQWSYVYNVSLFPADPGTGTSMRSPSPTSSTGPGEATSPQ